MQGRQTEKSDSGIYLHIVWVTIFLWHILEFEGSNHDHQRMGTAGKVIYIPKCCRVIVFQESFVDNFQYLKNFFKNGNW